MSSRTKDGDNHARHPALGLPPWPTRLILCGHYFRWTDRLPSLTPDWNALAKAHGTDAAGARRIAEADNLQRRVLEPDELGPMCVLLLSEEARGITGQVISVDGGYRV